MIRFILSFSVVCLAFQSQAMPPEVEMTLFHFEDYRLSRMQGWGVEGSVVLVEGEDSFCILSRSGGGDSGGGIVRNMEVPKLDPEDETKERIDNNWKDRFERFFDNDPIDINLQMFPEGMLHTDTTFDVLELLSCQNGQGIPFEVRANVKFLLSEMRSDALAQGRVDDVRFLSKVLNLLTMYDEI